MKHKVTHITDNTITDFDSGEVKSTSSSRTYRIPNEPSYIKVYIEDIGNIHGLSKSESDVLFSLAKFIGWDGIVSVSKTRFEKSIQPEIDIKYQTFKNIIRKLVDKGIFTRSGRGELEANPYIFAKGEWQDIYQRRLGINLEIKYSEKEGRRIFTTLSK